MASESNKRACRTRDKSHKSVCGAIETIGRWNNAQDSYNKAIELRYQQTLRSRAARRGKFSPTKSINGSPYKSQMSSTKKSPSKMRRENMSPADNDFETQFNAFKRSPAKERQGTLRSPTKAYQAKY